jgi:hypothetical protein
MPISNLTNIRCLLPLVLCVTLTGCKDDVIRTYRVAKDPAPQSTMPAAADAAPSALPEWKVPETWASQPPSAMRLASFRAGEVDMSVSKMPGTAGGTLANVNRWRGQIGLAPLTEGDLATAQKAVEVGGENSLLFEMAGEKPPEGKSQPQRMLVAIVPRAGESWFFKMTGDTAAVANESANFAAFLKSIRFK